MELTVEQIKRIVEASLLMNREPQTAKKLSELFTPEENINERAIIDTLTLLAEDYRGRGVELVEVASGYRFQVCADLAPWIQRTMAEKPQRYSRALLETLALIAYRQPITRAEIEEIRGVVVSTQIMRTLEEREWVRVIGHRDVPGRPALYATTKQFLNDLNLKSLGELPTLAELQDLDKMGGEFQQLNLDVSSPQESSAEETASEAPADLIAIDQENPQLEENPALTQTDDAENAEQLSLDRDEDNELQLENGETLEQEDTRDEIEVLESLIIEEIVEEKIENNLPLDNDEDDELQLENEETPEQEDTRNEIEILESLITEETVEEEIENNHPLDNEEDDKLELENEETPEQEDTGDEIEKAESLIMQESDEEKLEDNFESENIEDEAAESAVDEMQLLETEMEEDSEMNSTENFDETDDQESYEDEFESEEDEELELAEVVE